MKKTWIWVKNECTLNLTTVCHKIFFYWNQDASIHESEGEEVHEICDTKVDSESEGEMIIPKASKRKYNFCLFVENLNHDSVDTSTLVTIKKRT